MNTINPSPPHQNARPNLAPSPGQSQEFKGPISSALYAKRKNTIYDFAVNTASSSLTELDSSCNELGMGRVSCPNSATSTNDNSRWSFESRILSRNQSLESDLAESETPNKTPNKERISGISCLREKEVACPEILENSDEDGLESHNQSVEISRRFLDEEEKLRTPKITRDQASQLKFDSQSPFASSFRFSNDNKTIVHNSSNRFSTIFASQPLPTSGKVKFSVRVEHANQEKPKLYIGIASNDFKGKAIGYKTGCYFISTFTKESFVNRLHITKEDLLPKQGQIVTVYVDLDVGKISFEVDNQRILEGRIALSKTKINEFYPCVALGETGGSVSFV